MFCRKCGNELTEDSAFCMKCGTATSEKSESEPEKKESGRSSSRSKAKKEAEETYYELLGVLRNASTSEIEAAIKKERTVWANRVSRGGNMGERARRKVEKIGEAEKILLNTVKRKEYDASLEEMTKEEENEAVETKNWLDTVYKYYDSGDLEMAVQAIDRAIPQHRDNPEAWFLAANVYLSCNKLDDANKAAMETILLEPDNPLAYGMRGDIMLAQKGNASGAIEMYEKMAERAKTADIQKFAEEYIINAKVAILLEHVDAIIYPFAQGFKYDESSMQGLMNAKIYLVSLKNEAVALYDSETDPTEWMIGKRKEVLADLDDCIIECQGLIDEGNKPVIWNKRALAVIIMYACFFACISLIVAVFSPFGLFAALPEIAIAVVVAVVVVLLAIKRYRKPLYRVPDKVF